MDFIEVLSKVSLLFQRNDITLAAAKDGLEVARLELKAMVARPARKFSEFLNAARLDQSYKGVELRSRPDDLERLADNDGILLPVSNSILTEDSKAWWTI